MPPETENSRPNRLNRRIEPDPASVVPNARRKRGNPAVRQPAARIPAAPDLPEIAIAAQTLPEVQSAANRRAAAGPQAARLHPHSDRRAPVPQARNSQAQLLAMPCCGQKELQGRSGGGKPSDSDLRQDRLGPQSRWDLQTQTVQQQRPGCSPLARHPAALPRG